MRLPAYILAHPGGGVHLQQAKGIHPCGGGAGGVPRLYNLPAHVQAILNNSLIITRWQVLQHSTDSVQSNWHNSSAAVLGAGCL